MGSAPRLHECRDYRGHKGSFETTLTGVKVRLEDDRAENLEFAPSSAPFRVAGETMTATIYAFKKGKDATYRSNQGIIFTVNGQTHGHFTKDFYRRTKVGLSYVRDSVFVIINCSQLSVGAREDLFMNSRDRLSDAALRNKIESELEYLLKRHPGLRELTEKRRREELASRLDDSKPLEDVLENLLKQSPTLSKLFLTGNRISTPFKTVGAQSKVTEFKGNKYPTYFKFKGHDYGTELERNCHLNMRCRITFETDAVNDYFSRDIDIGEFSLTQVWGNSEVQVEDYTPSLHNGIFTLSLHLPSNCQVNDVLRFHAVVQDKTQLEPFSNRFSIKVLESKETRGGKSTRRKTPGDDPGKDREKPSGIVLPDINLVREPEWNEKVPPFDEYTALRVKNAGPVGLVDDDNNGLGDNSDVYDFYVNVDNTYLRHELKQGKKEVELAEAQFINGMVLLGLGMLHEASKSSNGSAVDNDESMNSDRNNIEDQIGLVTKALAPILLPMIDSLGELILEEV